MATGEIQDNNEEKFNDVPTGYDNLAEEVPFGKGNDLETIMDAVADQHEKETQQENQELIEEAHAALAQDYNVLANLIRPNFESQSEQEQFEQRAIDMGLEGANVGVVDYLIEQDEIVDELSAQERSLKEIIDNSSKFAFFSNRNYKRQLEQITVLKHAVFSDMERFLPDRDQTGTYGYAQFFAGALKEQSYNTTSESGQVETVPALSFVEDIKIQRDFIWQMNRRPNASGRAIQETNSNIRTKTYMRSQKR